MKISRKFGTAAVLVFIALSIPVIIFASKLEKGVPWKKDVVENQKISNSEYQKYMLKASTQEQRDALTKLERDHSMGLGVWKRDALLIIGKLPRDTRRLTLDDAKRIIAVNKDGNTILNAFNYIAGAPDWEGDSEIQQIIYFLDNKRKQAITIMLNRISYVVYSGKAEQQTQLLIDLSEIKTGMAKKNLLEPFDSKIKMQNDKIGWAYRLGFSIKGEILYTKDSGKTWTEVELDTKILSNIRQVITLNQSIWIIFKDETVGMIKLIHSTDQGGNWNEIELPQLKELNADIYWLDERNGWLKNTFASGLSYNNVDLYGTEDGGRTWTLLAKTDKLPEKGIQQGIAFANQLKGWISPNVLTETNPWLYGTVDGGVSWNKEELPLLEEAFQQELVPYMVGKVQTFQGTEVVSVTAPCQLHSCVYILQKLSQSLEWSMVSKKEIEAEPEKLSEVRFGSLEQSYFHDSNKLFITRNRGFEWKEIGVGLIISDSSSHGTVIRDVQFIDGQKGWVIIEMNGVQQVYKTVDGGKSWSK